MPSRKIMLFSLGPDSTFLIPYMQVRTNFSTAACDLDGWDLGIRLYWVDWSQGKFIHVLKQEQWYYSIY